LACIGLLKDLYDWHDDDSWSKMEQVARKVDEVTRPGAPFDAEEHVYFLTRRTPPPGHEYRSSHYLRLAPEFSKLVHIVPQPEVDRQMAAGAFATVETCDGPEWVKQRDLEQIFRQKFEVGDCAVFWDPSQTGR
jgi:hypothetical protein